MSHGSFFFELHIRCYCSELHEYEDEPHSSVIFGKEVGELCFLVAFMNSNGSVRFDLKRAQGLELLSGHLLFDKQTRLSGLPDFSLCFPAHGRTVGRFYLFFCLIAWNRLL